MAARERQGLLRCYRCGEFKCPTEFNWRRKARGERDSHCRPCRADYKREHYERNRQAYIDRATERKQRLNLERTQYLIDYFLSHPCVDCGESDPVVLEFDHLRDKEFNIGAAIARNSWARILKEMEKCEVVCRNCHRRRESTRSGALRIRLTQSQRQLDV